jgi:hypothetical protein
MYNRAYPYDPYRELPLTIRLTLDYSFNETITHHSIECILESQMELENIETFHLVHTQDATFVGEPIFKTSRVEIIKYGFMLNISEDKKPRYAFSALTIERTSLDSWGYYKGTSSFEFYLHESDEPVPCDITVELGPRVV